MKKNFTMSMYILSVICCSLAACSEEDDDNNTNNNNNNTNNNNNNTNNNNNSNAPFYFDAVIDGQQLLLEDGKNGIASGAGAGGGTTTAGCEEEQSLNLISAFNLDHGAGVLFLKNLTDCATECSELEAIFSIGNYSYGKREDNNGPGTDGVVVYYGEASGTYWASDLGSGSQTGSTFQITAHIDNNDGFSERITTASFTCKLYDGNGNSKTVTSGKIKSRSVQCGHL